MSVSSVIGVTKDTFALARDVCLFILAVLLLLYPSAFNSILTRAGFVQGNFGVLTWKSQLSDSSNALQAANQTITQLRQTNATLTGELQQIQSTTPDPGQAQKIQQLRSVISSQDRAAFAVQTRAYSTLMQSRALLARPHN